MSGVGACACFPCDDICCCGVLSDRYFQLWLIVLVFYSAWVSPFEFGFIENPRGGLLAADNVVNGFFGIDIILTFFVAYLDPRTFLMVDNYKRIALRYDPTSEL